MSDQLEMLLVEPATLLRRTVALTARSLGMATVHEAASHTLALNLLKRQRFGGVLIAIDPEQGDTAASALALLDRVRAGDFASHKSMPIAVMMESCDPAMLTALRNRGVAHILLKPFKARNLIATFAAFAKPTAGVAPGNLYQVRES